MRQTTKYIFIAIISVITLLNIFRKPLVIFAQDSNDNERETCSLQEINEGFFGEKITFNSIIISETDNDWYKAKTGNDIPVGTLRNEPNFVGARENTGINAGANNKWNGNEITVKKEQFYILRIYVHNNGPNGTNGTAENTRVLFDIPKDSSTNIEVKGMITSSNATPTYYQDSVNFISEVPFHLEYVYGSALLENGGIGAKTGLKLSDDIIKTESGGVLIGYDALDGNIPGGYKYINYVTIEVKAVYDYEFGVETQVRLANGTDTDWHDTVKATVGDQVEIQIKYINESNMTQENVTIKNVLPNNLSYVNSSAKLYNVDNPDGIAFEYDDYNDIGDYVANAEASICFTAEVVNDSLVDGENSLINLTQIGVGTTTLQDQTTIIVQNDTHFWTKVVFLLSLIFILVVLTGILLYRTHAQKV